MFKKAGKANEPQGKLNKNAASMQRRLHTPTTLTYKWFHFGILFITTGIFLLINYVLSWILVKGGQPVYFGLLSSYRVANNYNPDVIRYIYYVDYPSMHRLILPSVILVIVGTVMLIWRHYNYKSYVKRAHAKQRKQV